MPDIDPYHKWFGIAPKDQPPHHYRLLGVDLFEADPDVIEAAADQRMTYLHGCAAGEYVELGEKLLDEVSHARITLLDPNKKAQYDTGLISKLGPKLSEPSTAAFDAPQATFPQPVANSLAVSWSDQNTAASSSSGRHLPLVLIFSAAAGALLLIGVLVVVVRATIGSGEVPPNVNSQTKVADEDAVETGSKSTDTPGPDETPFDERSSATVKAAEKEKKSTPEISVLTMQTPATCEMACCSPDGKHIATADWDSKIRVWSAATLKLERTLAGHEQGVIGCTFVDPAGATLVSASRDGTVRVWNVEHGVELEQIRLPKSLGYLSRSVLGGRVFAGSTDGHTFEVHIGHKEFFLLPLTHAGQWVTTLEPDSNGELLFFTSLGGRVDVWDLGIHQKSLSFPPPEKAQKIIPSEDGKLLAIGCQDGTVLLYDRVHSEVVWRAKEHSFGVNSLAFSPNGEYLLSSGNWAVIVWHVADGRVKKVHWPGKGKICSIEFSPDGDRVLIAQGRNGNKLHIWPTSKILAE